MTGTLLRRGLTLFLGVLMGLASGSPAAAGPTDQPAIVLTAFGTSTAAFATYRHVEEQVKARYPGYEIRWAFTSRKVRRKLAEEQGRKLNDLPGTLRDLQAAGFTRVAIQSLHIVPGQEWEKKIVEESGKLPGLKVALGRPLMSSERDQERVLAALASGFPADLQNHAVIVVAHGSPKPEGEAVYLAFQQRLRAHYPGKNVFLGTVQNEPSGKLALAAVQRSGAKAVIFVPLLLVAGEHVDRDILGSGPESWKSQLLAHKACRIEGGRQGLGDRDDIIAIYLDHLHEALQTLSK
jgi:sirohydrochlorin cobaltochelatase